MVIFACPQAYKLVVCFHLQCRDNCKLSVTSFKLWHRIAVCGRDDNNQCRDDKTIRDLDQLLRAHNSKLMLNNLCRELQLLAVHFQLHEINT